MSSVSDFTALITSEHQSSPKFVATIAASVEGFVDQINVASSASEFYDLDNAVGVQLDAVGLWVGISRYAALPIEQYFSWDTNGLGWDQGIWYQIGDPETEVTTLVDADYRQVIRAKILCNQWDGSLPTALTIVQTAIGNNAIPISVTERSMAVNFAVEAPISRVLQAILEGGYLPIRPMGVNVSFTFN
ncbi:DUF2612 domain-containing protein [Asaia bogorensis]|uniref:DUF2612 domain-containing protein n=1 Tax=Asaia bogorensis TaxID=91915 RepID=UPI0028553628|nr:DUF2612 domain-containing protein [Asaia bogorensis]MDR6182064.1 hypothetical protein [Asaia bogorensis NBRC 16594]